MVKIIINLMIEELYKRIKQKNKYYCSEFVKHVLDQAGIKNNLPDVVKPMDFLELEKYDVVYEGVLKDY